MSKTPEPTAEQVAHEATWKAERDARDEATRIQAEKEAAAQRRAEAFAALEHPTDTQWLDESGALNEALAEAGFAWLISGDDPWGSAQGAALTAEIAVVRHHLNWALFDPDGYTAHQRRWAELRAGLRGANLTDIGWIDRR